MVLHISFSRRLAAFEKAFEMSAERNKSLWITLKSTPFCKMMIIGIK